MNRLEQVGEIALMWAQANAEHKQLKIESKRAAVLALRLGAAVPIDSELSGDRQWIVETPDQEMAANRAIAAYNKYKAAARKAGVLRATITRMARTSVVPDAEIAAAWNEFLERERKGEAA